MTPGSQHVTNEDVYLHAYALPVGLCYSSA